MPQAFVCYSNQFIGSPTKKASDPILHTTLNSTVESDQFQRLCRGEILRSPTLDRSLTCKLTHMGAPYLRIAPLKVEVISESPLVAVLREFISPTEADGLVRKAGTEPRYTINKNNNTCVWQLLYGTKRNTRAPFFVPMLQDALQIPTRIPET